MSDESVEVQIAQIDGRLKTMQVMLDGRLGSIETRLAIWTQCRHITKEGDCDFFSTVVDHDRKINQWTGALAAVSLVCALIGGVIGAVISGVLK